ncbi:MAG: hypothetical protein KA375_08530 [Vitreoscilla sp.]|nr:hypothetical protein [Vitreoscilla sp.]MBP6674873.1 hypothetical protein [Vitreoscilla sp.]
MHDFKWSDSEKKLARRLFDAALQAELAEVLAELKRQAEAATTPDAMWDVEDYLTRRRRDIDQKYDYRYSQLILVFGWLLREGRLQPDQFAGLSEEKRAAIQRFLSF